MRSLGSLEVTRGHLEVNNVYHICFHLAWVQGSIILLLPHQNQKSKIREENSKRGIKREEKKKNGKKKGVKGRKKEKIKERTEKIS